LVRRGEIMPKRVILSGIPDDVNKWVTERAKRLNIPKSAVFKEAVEMYRGVLLSWEKIGQMNVSQFNLADEVVKALREVQRTVDDLKRRVEKLERKYEEP